MPYSEDAEIVTCGKCGSVNHIIIGYAGYGPANERETAHCYFCGGDIHQEECLIMCTGRTPEDSEEKLRKLQGRK